MDSEIADLQSSNLKQFYKKVKHPQIIHRNHLPQGTGRHPKTSAEAGLFQTLPGHRGDCEHATSRLGPSGGMLKHENFQHQLWASLGRIFGSRNFTIDMGVSTNGGTLKWMVYSGRSHWNG